MLFEGSRVSTWLSSSVGSGLEYVTGIPQAVQGGAHQDAGPALGCGCVRGLLLYQLLVHLASALVLSTATYLQPRQPPVPAAWPPSCQMQPANLWAAAVPCIAAFCAKPHRLLWSMSCAQCVCPAGRVAARECGYRGGASQGRRTERAPVMLLLLWASSVRPIQWAGSQ